MSLVSPFCIFNIAHRPLERKQFLNVPDLRWKRMFIIGNCDNYYRAGRVWIMLLLEQMLVLFLIICVGYYCYKKEIITKEVNGKLSAIVVNIANPALILSGGMVEGIIFNSPEKYYLLFQYWFPIVGGIEK